MEKNEILVKKTFYSILSIRVLSMASAIACIMIDAMVTGNFLGSNAVAAMGLIQPVTMFCNIVGPLFGPGTGIVCTKYMGMAKLDRVNQVFSVVMSTLFTIIVTIAVLLFFCSPFIANWLGARTNDPEIIRMVMKYLKGYSFGLPFMVLTLVLSGLMVVDNDRAIGFISVFVTLIADVSFDLLNAVVLHGGMLGMALATSFSNMLGFAVVMLHFLKKDRVLHFKPVGMKTKDLEEVVKNGVPNAITAGSDSLKGFVFNMFLLIIASKTEVAALSVTNSIFAVVTAISLGFYGATSTIVSLFYGEEDRNSMLAAFCLSLKTAVAVFGAIMIIILIFAEGITGCFLESDDVMVQAAATIFTRFMAIRFFMMSISYSFSGSYQSSGHSIVNYILVSLREAVFPILCVLSLGSVFGVKGVGYGFAAAGILSFLFCIFMPAVINKRLSFKASDMLLLKDDFGSDPEYTFEASVQDMEGAMSASRQVMEFCKDRELNSCATHRISLFLEEVLCNIIRYGYSGKDKNVDVRVILGKDHQTIRIRDDGKPFDPLEWYKKNNPVNPEDGVGIRIVMNLVKDVTYVPAMGLNNLVLNL